MVDYPPYIVPRYPDGLALWLGRVFSGVLQRGKKAVVARPSRVFGCGLSRTGKTSLAEALRILGYRPVKYPLNIDCLEAEYDAAVDITVVAWMDEIDRRFPDAKWVLTVRDEREWLHSASQFFRRSLVMFEPEMTRFFMTIREQVYGSAEFDAATWSQVYRSHQDRVRRKFGDQPGKLLVMDVGEGNPWSALCDFLSLPKPDVPFPHLNRIEDLAPFPHRTVI